MYLPLMPHYSIEITEKQSSLIVDRTWLEQVIRYVLDGEHIETARISMVCVDDPEIHRLNRDFLGHDFPTDVISFLLNDPSDPQLSGHCGLDDGEDHSDRREAAVDGERFELDGELIVSTETAIREAAVHGWSPAAELVLYVVHGLLHLCGYDDLTDDSRPVMRQREREVLAVWGLCPTGLEQ